jgi:hypothetical protein
VFFFDRNEEILSCNLSPVDGTLVPAIKTNKIEIASARRVGQDEQATKEGSRRMGGDRHKRR